MVLFHFSLALYKTWCKFEPALCIQCGYVYKIGNDSIVSVLFPCWPYCISIERWVYSIHTRIDEQFLKLFMCKHIKSVISSPKCLLEVSMQFRIHTETAETNHIYDAYRCLWFCDLSHGDSLEVFLPLHFHKNFDM